MDAANVDAEFKPASQNALSVIRDWDMKKGWLMNSTRPSPGTHTLNEIMSQPSCWQECLNELERSGQLDKMPGRLAPQADWLFIGCGSSYYIALAAAASWAQLTGLRARAVPASEVLLFPDLLLTGKAPCQPVLISRSGRTSEVLKAAEYLESTRKIRTLAISCAADQPLGAICTISLNLVPADEKSTVMTRSFSSMLLGLQALAAAVAGKREFIEALGRVPAAAQAALEAMRPRIASFVQLNEFNDYVFLGQGPFFGIASESHLKVKEMSCSCAQCYHSLEFRHGPMSAVRPDTLMTFFLSESAYKAEREVLEEMKELGAKTLVVTNAADERVRHAADLLIELNLDVPECARLVVHVLAGQLLGYYTALKKGMDPDNPRFLSRVVILNEKAQGI
jgi:glucosamine--fructose-6-phosphate aminotransferase (isomerizing)